MKGKEMEGWQLATPARSRIARVASSDAIFSRLQREKAQDGEAARVPRRHPEHEMLGEKRRGTVTGQPEQETGT